MRLIIIFLRPCMCNQNHLPGTKLRISFSNHSRKPTLLTEIEQILSNSFTHSFLSFTKGFRSDQGSYCHCRFLCNFNVQAVTSRPRSTDVCDVLRFPVVRRNSPPTMFPSSPVQFFTSIKAILSLVNSR